MSARVFSRMYVHIYIYIYYHIVYYYYMRAESLSSAERGKGQLINERAAGLRFH